MPDDEASLWSAVERKDPHALLGLLPATGGVPFRPLRRWAAGDQAEELAALVTAALEVGDDRQRIELARSALSGTRLAHSTDLLLTAIAVAGDRFRAFLHRSVFPELLERGVVYEALYSAVTLSDASARSARVEQLRTALAASDEALLEVMAADTRWTPPEGFVVVKTRIGTGKTSRVALVKRTADDALFAWKIPADDSATVREDAGLVVERSREWVRLAVSTAPIERAPDGRTLLQKYVEGETLGRAMQNAALLKDAGDVRHAALADLLRRLVDGRTFVSGLNPDNLVYDGETWQVIDSGSVRPQATAAAAWLRIRKASRKNWTRGAMARHQEAVEWFLERTERSLGISRLALFRERFRPRR